MAYRGAVAVVVEQALEERRQCRPHDCSHLILSGQVQVQVQVAVAEEAEQEAHRPYRHPAVAPAPSSMLRAAQAASPTHPRQHRQQSRPRHLL
jgi:hypothetical protein